MGAQQIYGKLSSSPNTSSPTMTPSLRDKTSFTPMIAAFDSFQAELKGKKGQFGRSTEITVNSDRHEGMRGKRLECVAAPKYCGEISETDL